MISLLGLEGEQVILVLPLCPPLPLSLCLQEAGCKIGTTTRRIFQ